MAKAPESAQAKPAEGKFTFNLGTVKEIPVTVRAPTVARDFPFDDMDVSKNNHLHIPLDYWTKHKGMKGDQVEPAKIKDRVRRSFYGWQNQSGKAEARANLTLALS